MKVSVLLKAQRLRGAAFKDVATFQSQHTLLGRKCVNAQEEST